LSNGRIPVPIELGNVYAKRDWSDSEDFVHCVWMMLNQEKHRSELDVKSYHTPFYTKESIAVLKEYVLSSNETHTIKEFVELSFKCLNINGYWQGEGVDEKFIQNDTTHVLVQINTNFYRPAEVELLWGDSSQFRNDFNWTPKTPFNELVQKMVLNDHYLKCKEFLNK